MPGNEVDLKKETVTCELTVKEYSLIKQLRIVRFGQVMVEMQEGQPVRIEEIKKSIIL